MPSTTRETWSGIIIQWPVDELSERLPVELSGLPVFDRDRSFRGYRGFGVCRDIARINQLTRARRERPIGFMPVPETPRQDTDDAVVAPQTDTAGDNAAAAASPPATEAAAGARDLSRHYGRRRCSAAERPALTVTPGSANVVPFRAGPAARTESAQLEPGGAQGVPGIGAGTDVSPARNASGRRRRRERARRSDG